MTITDALNIVFASVVSIGGASAIIFGMSSFLGKVWADRILEADKKRYVNEFEELKKRLDVEKQIQLGTRDEKIRIYKSAIDIIAEVLSAIDAYSLGHLDEQQIGDIFNEFNRKRLNVYGYIGMFAPQYVMDAQDDLMDYVLQSIHGTEQYEWEVVRKKTLFLLNAIRKDIGISQNSITYNGVL